MLVFITLATLYHFQFQGNTRFIEEKERQVSNIYKQSRRPSAYRSVDPLGSVYNAKCIVPVVSAGDFFLTNNYSFDLYIFIDSIHTER